jgi:arsenate reductase
MAHGWMSELSDKVEVYSAGTKPAEKVNPFAVKAMQKFNIDISSNTTNDVREYEEMNFDLVLTVCDKAKKACPIVLNTLESIHESFPDPVEFEGTNQEKLDHYIEVCTSMKGWIHEILIQKDLVKDY